MTPETMPEPDGPEDERFVYVVTAAGVEALRRSAPSSTASGRQSSLRQSPDDPSSQQPSWTPVTSCRVGDDQVADAETCRREGRTRSS